MSNKSLQAEAARLRYELLELMSYALVPGILMFLFSLIPGTQLPGAILIATAFSTLYVYLRQSIRKAGIIRRLNEIDQKLSEPERLFVPKSHTIATVRALSNDYRKSPAHKRRSSTGN